MFFRASYRDLLYHADASPNFMGRRDFCRIAAFQPGDGVIYRLAILGGQSALVNKVPALDLAIDQLAILVEG